MGLPTRLHGDVFANLPKAVEGFCPICISFTTWKLVKGKDSYYKKCVVCGRKKEVKEDELKKLAEKERTKQLKERAKKKEDTKK